MKKVWSIILVAVLMTVILTACSGDPLVGTWGTTIDGDYGEMTLNADGTGTLVSNMETRSCYWEVEGDTLTVVQNIEGYEYTFLNKVNYTVEWSTLTVTHPETGNTLEFKRK